MIFNFVKTYLGVPVEDDGFDIELLSVINATVSTMYQFGIESLSSFVVVDADTEWPPELSSDTTLLSLVNLFLAQSVKKVYDPTASATVAKAVDETIVEYGQRILHHITMSTLLTEEV